jgi:glycine hydroxymethyltransferase
VSRAVLEAQGSVLTNKYAEGYPGRRYYGGCEFVDEAETLRSSAPSAVRLRLRQRAAALRRAGEPGRVPGAAPAGRRLHGPRPRGRRAPDPRLAANLSGKWFKPVPYTVRREDQLIDMEEVARIARENRPKLIIAGGSAYARHWDFARFRAIADEVGALFMVDMAHFAGLVAGGAHPSPLPHAHVVTTTTHKTLRGPRGGMILTDDEALAKKFNSAVFPGLQGGPLMHVIAAKAVAFGEALRPEFRVYSKAVVSNARALAEELRGQGLDIVTGGTDNHLLLVDLRPKRVTGKAAEAALNRAHLTCNKNAIPFDPEKPFVTSGVRLGSPAATTRGFGEAEFREVGRLIGEVLDGLARANDGAVGNTAAEASVKARVLELCGRFPIYRD